MIEFRHPEQRIGEILLTNSTSADFQLIGWQSKRKGQIAYALTDDEVRPMDSRDFFPVFVSVDELKRVDLLDKVAAKSYGGKVRLLYDDPASAEILAALAKD